MFQVGKERYKGEGLGGGDFQTGSPTNKGKRKVSNIKRVHRRTGEALRKTQRDLDGFVGEHECRPGRSVYRKYADFTPGQTGEKISFKTLNKEGGGGGSRAKLVIASEPHSRETSRKKRASTRTKHYVRKITQEVEGPSHGEEIEGGKDQKGR